MANDKKQSLVDRVVESIEGSTNFALIKFEKTKHTTLENLRKELKPANASFSVVKNTLFEKAINRMSTKKKELQDFKKQAFPLKENSAMLTLKGDWSAGLKAFYTFIKKEETMGFKFGFIDNTIYDESTLKRLAQLPGKNELVAKMLGSFKSPMARTTRALQFNMQKLVYVLSQKSQQS